MEKGCECRCSAAFVAAIGIMMAANGGIQLATGIIFTFLVPLFLTGSNIGVGIVDLLFGLIITYLATSRLNCVREMKINLVLATVVGIINLGNLILMELGEWRFFDWTAHTTGIARQAPNLVQIAYYTTTLPSAIVLLLVVADLQYVGYSLAGYRKTPKAADNETTLKMHFSEESLNSCRGRGGHHTPTSLFGWVFGDTEISSTKSNFSGEGMRSNSATSTRKLNADTMGLLYPDEGDTSSNESTPAERFATFSPRTTNWTLKPKDPIPTKQMKSLNPHDLETPPQGRNRQPQNVCFAPVKAKKLEEQISLVNHHNLNDTYTVSQQKCAVNCNSPYFRENPHKFLAAKLLAEAVCSSSRKTDPNCNNYNNNNNEITPTHFKLRSEETSLPSTIARDHLFHISTPDISPTSKTLQEEFGPTDPESLVQLTRLELIARQWRLSAQHRDIHARVSHRLSKSKESD